MVVEMKTKPHWGAKPFTEVLPPGEIISLSYFFESQTVLMVDKPVMLPDGGMADKISFGTYNIYTGFTVESTYTGENIKNAPIPQNPIQSAIDFLSGRKITLSGGVEYKSQT